MYGAQSNVMRTNVVLCSAPLISPIDHSILFGWLVIIPAKKAKHDLPSVRSERHPALHMN